MRGRGGGEETKKGVGEGEGEEDWGWLREWSREGFVVVLKLTFEPK